MSKMSEFLSHARFEPLRAALPLHHALEILVVTSPRGTFLNDLLVNDSKLDPLAIALLWLYVDDLERSHVICQDYPSGLGAYIHGVVHRREGDFWNSKYWFRRTSVRIDGVHPIEFVEQVEADAGQNRTSLLEIQRKEWLGLMEMACAQ